MVSITEASQLRACQDTFCLSRWVRKCYLQSTPRKRRRQQVSAARSVASCVGPLVGFAFNLGGGYCLPDSSGGPHAFSSRTCLTATFFLASARIRIPKGMAADIPVVSKRDPNEPCSNACSRIERPYCRKFYPGADTRNGRRPGIYRSRSRDGTCGLYAIREKYAVRQKCLCCRHRRRCAAARARPASIRGRSAARRCCPPGSRRETVRFPRFPGSRPA
jgi:hypothetical protein